MRLDVVLHGSSKPVGMSELRFGARFDVGDENDTPAPDVDFIELHPLGRVENCYRWAGETDEFEAIEAVCRNYNMGSLHAWRSSGQERHRGNRGRRA